MPSKCAWHLHSTFERRAQWSLRLVSAAVRLLLCRHAAASAGAEHTLPWNNHVGCCCESSRQGRSLLAAVLEVMGHAHFVWRKACVYRAAHS